MCSQCLDGRREEPSTASKYFEVIFCGVEIIGQSLLSSAALLGGPPETIDTVMQALTYRDTGVKGTAKVQRPISYSRAVLSVLDRGELAIQARLKSCRAP